MVPNLIAQVSRSDGSAGPLVAKGGGLIPLRDWLCDALTPMGQRDRVGGIILLSFDERLHVDRRNQANIMAEALREPPPKMARRTRLHGHDARRLLAQNSFELRARHGPVR